MKVSIRCRSALLETSLKKFLAGMVTDEESCDAVISDYSYESDKPVLRIGVDDEADLKKPFSRSQLMIRLEEKAAQGQSRAIAHAFGVEEEESLEEKIERLTRVFVEEIMHVVKEHYEK